MVTLRVARATIHLSFFFAPAASRRLSDPRDKEFSLLLAGELFRMLRLLTVYADKGKRERSHGAFDVFHAAHGYCASRVPFTFQVPSAMVFPPSIIAEASIYV